MPDEITESGGTPLSIIIDVQSKAATRRLKEWNKLLAASANETQKKEALMHIKAEAERLGGMARGRGSYARKKDYSKIYKESERQLSALAATAAARAAATSVRAETPAPRETPEPPKVEPKKGREVVPKEEVEKIPTPEPPKVELGAYDKVVQNTKEIARWLTETEKGIATTTKWVSGLDDTEPIIASETLKKAKGTFIESGEMKGETVLQTQEADKLRIRTQEIANGFKTIREYVKLSNGEVYLLAEKISLAKKNADEGKKSFGDMLKGLGGSMMNRAQKNMKEMTSGKLLKRIGSIITYRVARSIMSGITNGAKQGFSLLSQDNETVKGIMEQFDQIKTTLQVSFATVLIPVAEALSTALEPIAQELLDFANAMSLANAQAKGESQYYKLSSESINEYAKSLKQANQQLSQLDKFATLSGSSTPKLGVWESIDDLLPEDKELAEKYKDTTDFFLNLSTTIKTVTEKIGGFFDDFGKNIKWITALAGLLVTAINPLAGLIIGFGLAAVGASPGAKVLGTAMLALAGGLIGYGIAKQFAKNPWVGLAAGAAGGLLVGTITSIVSSLGTGDSVNTNTATTPSVTSGNIIGEADLYRGIEEATSRSYSTSGATTVKGDVYIDGQKAGRILENSVYSEGKRVGHFGG